jgi:hypothetical protein
MTSKELRAYALVHREDDDVFGELIKRVQGTGTSYPYPQTEADLEEMKRLFQRKTFGGSRGLQMNKPDFSKMTKKQLRDYALVHREDDAVFAELIKRVQGTGTRYPYPQTEEDFEEMKRILHRRLYGDDAI